MRIRFKKKELLELFSKDTDRAKEAWKVLKLHEAYTEYFVTTELTSEIHNLFFKEYREVLQNYVPYDNDLNSLRNDQIELCFQVLTDYLLDLYGIEYLEHESDYNEYIAYTNIYAEYLNSGDCYNATIVYDYRKNRILLTTVGDYIKSLPKKYREY